MANKQKRSAINTQLLITALDRKLITTNPDTGQILRNGKKCYIERNNVGYWRFRIQIDVIKKWIFIHKAIWFSVYGIIEDDSLQLDHIDRNQDNNSIANLRLVTALENMENTTGWDVEPAF